MSKLQKKLPVDWFLRDYYVPFSCKDSVVVVTSPSLNASQQQSGGKGNVQDVPSSVSVLVTQCDLRCDCIGLVCSLDCDIPTTHSTTVQILRLVFYKEEDLIQFDI